MRFQISCCLVFVLSFSVGAYAQQTVTASINHQGTERDYRLYVPANYDGEEAWPLVFNLHGLGSSALQQQFYSLMDEVADTARFLVCYPNGIDQGWNVGWDFGSEADDVAFFNELIDSLAESYAIDLDRVYSCGMSNGGFMSYRLACELPDRITAVASVTGAMSTFQSNNCTPGTAVPVLEIHGTADEVVPYEGQAGVNIPIDEVIQFWVSNNGCNAEPTITDIPNTNNLDGSTASRFDYDACEGDTQVSLIKVEGGGHTWPGAAFIIGVTNQDFAASPTIWNFFKPFSLNTPTSTENLAAANQLHLFPNPSQQILHLTLAEGPTALPYRIYSLQGRLLAEGRLQNRTTRIDISALPNGAYYILLGNAAEGRGRLFIKE